MADRGGRTGVRFRAFSGARSPAVQPRFLLKVIMSDGSVVPEPPSGIPVWTVASLLLAVTDALGARFSAVAVKGELSSLSRPASGHLYFSLKDADGEAALLRCAMFRRAAGLLDFAPREGQQVEVRGRLALYEPRGDLQFIVESMQRVGAGSLYEEFLRLRARLQAQGLLDPSRRRSIPAWPRAIGVVTSPGAAALRDVLTALARRAPQIRVVIYPCLVQGEQAPASIVGALRQAGERGEVDTLLLVRGGGSLEDLWAFNDERVVRAVSASLLPVICGVGHETDITLSDLAADLRAPTPTAAAELATPQRDEALLQLDQLARRLHHAAARHLERQAQRLDLLGQRAGRPGAVLQAQSSRLDAWSHRMHQAAFGRIGQDRPRLPALARRLSLAAASAFERRRLPLQGLATRLDAAHPRQVLQRGYAWVTDGAGNPVLRAAALCPGQEVQAVFSDGLASARVDTVRLTEAGPDGIPLDR